MGYVENPCVTCTHRIRRGILVVDNGLTDIRMRQFCLIKSTFVDDRRGPCSKYEGVKK